MKESLFMKIESDIDYDFVNGLYYKLLNERDLIVRRKLKEDIKSRFSPYEFLKYSARNSFMPLKAFRKVFSLSDLFKALEEMQKQAEDIRNLAQQPILIKDIDDVKSISDFATRETLLDKSDFCFLFEGSMIFEYGDYKNIGENFENVHVNNLSLEQIEQMVKNKRNCKGIPITITIDNIGELPLTKLAIIEQYFEIDGIKIIDNDKEKSGRKNQGESTPLNLNTYKKIRAIIDDIVHGLYVDEKSSKVQADFQLATQIIDSVAQRVEYDSDAAQKANGSIEVINASGMVGLLTGRAICKGYSEILRNIMSCVNIECSSIEGIATVNSNEDHSWNQVKIGEHWYNVDLTFARKAILEGKPSGDLFMSDKAFFGDRKWYTFEKGKVIKGKNIESTVMIGGHSQQIYCSNYKPCEGYIIPYITTSFMERARHFDDIYKKDGCSPDYKGYVPYIGSSVEKVSFNAKNDKTPTHSEH